MKFDFKERDASTLYGFWKSEVFGKERKRKTPFLKSGKKKHEKDG